uniref:tetratricopeptide repeat protein n=1 Tax=Pararhizobium sp. IMCC3301 TaxID=3067904 RepID=UPI002742119E|nr:hypothetical protein [Pararhizobium sp. IMCC3301]
MAPYQTSEFSYVFREGYDYISYLEKKSHFDRVEIAVDSGIRKLVASNEELAKSQLQATSQLGADIREGFEGLSVSIDAVRHSIEDLKSVCENGFAQIDLSLNYIDQSIQQLIRIAQTPDQTWALEQYSIATDAFRKNFAEEALDYVNRAILGHGDRSGYRLEHRFYMLRGLIRLGNYKNHTPEILDLKAASEDFLLGARYAEHDSQKDCARSFGLAGWASYCAGRMEDAQKYLNRSIEINGADNQSKFELSKVLFHVGNKPEAKRYFSDTLRNDWKYALRAGSDEDFLKYRKDVEECINSYLSELRQDLSKAIGLYDRLELTKKQTVLSRYGLNLDTSPQSFFTKLKSSIKAAPIADLETMKSAVDENLRSLEDGLSSAKNQIRERARGMRGQKNPSVFDGPEYAWIPILFAVGTFIFYGASQPYFFTSNGAHITESTIAVIFGFFYSILVGILTFFVLIPAAKWVMNSTSANERGKSASEMERDLALL